MSLTVSQPVGPRGVVSAGVGAERVSAPGLGLAVDRVGFTHHCLSSTQYAIEWYPEIIKNIQSASDVVCLLTERSIDRPWILFEAGMAKGKLDTPILGVALGVELKMASVGPFAQFQNCADDEESLTKLVFQLVNRIPNSEPDRDTIRFQVGKFKATAEKILKSISGTSPSHQSAKRQTSDEIENSSAKLFEEIKIMFQDLPSRIDRVDSSKRRLGARKFHPGMLEDLLFRTRDPVCGARMGLSFLRDIAPWIYDEGTLLLTRFKVAKSPQLRADVLRELEELVMELDAPFIERMLISSEEEYRLVRELPRMILHRLHTAIEEK